MANPGACRLSAIAKAAEEGEEEEAAAEEEEAAVATGPAGNGPVDLISPGTEAAAATLASMRRSTEAPPARERQGWRGGFRRPNWAALEDLSPPHPQVSTESGLQSLIYTQTTLDLL